MIQIKSNCKVFSIEKINVYYDCAALKNIFFFVYFKMTYLSRKLPLNHIPL